MSSSHAVLWPAPLSVLPFHKQPPLSNADTSDQYIQQALNVS